jgi:hypothetical protein
MCGKMTAFKQAALRWFESTCPLQPFPDTQNWKVLKKLLAASLFGTPEGRFFPSPWNLDEVASYIRSLDNPGRATRVSAFANDVSCHARSEVIDKDCSGNDLLSFLRSLDPETTLNIFPQQNPDQMCFRVVFAETGLIVEAGWGQAMYVFESERGYHPIVSCRGSSADDLRVSGIAAPKRLSSAVEIFLSSQRRHLQVIYDTLPAMLGAKHLAIEGYFDPATCKLVIVDMDIPLDLAWN